MSYTCITHYICITIAHFFLQCIVRTFIQASRLANFKNIAQSVVNRHQRWFCYQMASSKGELLRTALECGQAVKSSGGPTVLRNESSTLKQAILCVLPGVSLASTVFRAV